MRALVLNLLVWAVVLFALYWVIRVAVRHALEDVNGRRTVPFSPVPARPAGRRTDSPDAD